MSDTAAYILGVAFCSVCFFVKGFSVGDKYRSDTIQKERVAARAAERENERLERDIRRIVLEEVAK